jgi:hypothetical protein
MINSFSRLEIAVTLGVVAAALLPFSPPGTGAGEYWQCTASCLCSPRGPICCSVFIAARFHLRERWTDREKGISPILTVLPNHWVENDVADRKRKWGHSEFLRLIFGVMPTRHSFLSTRRWQSFAPKNAKLKSGSWGVGGKALGVEDVRKITSGG